MNIFTAIGQFFTNWGAKLASTFLEDDRYMMLVEGLRNTAIITLGALCIGIVIGALVAIIKYCGEGNPAMKPLCVLCDIYTTVIRGIPVVVLLLIFYFVIMKSASGVSGGIAVGIVTFGINSGAYMAELMRSGIGAVDAGQMEAGRSLGMSRIQTTIHVILPQAMSTSIPAFVANIIFLLKETSVFSAISLMDLMFTAKDLIGLYYKTTESLFLLVVFYLLILLPVSIVGSLVERRMRYAGFGD